MRSIVTFSAGTLLLSLLAIAVPAMAQNDAAYIRGALAPWGVTTNEQAMDAVFGAGNWDDLRMADGAGPFAPGSGYSVIFLEGGDASANELNAYLNAHRAAIEAFVSGGGRLLLNSAPNQGGDIDFGFGGITLDYNNGDGWFAETVVAADANHPVFVGPFVPVGTDYTGTSFGHAIIQGPVTPIILSDDPQGTAAKTSSSASRVVPLGNGGDVFPPVGSVVLGERTFGSGLLLVGGMTTDNFHDPDPEAANLRANIIHYLANAAIVGGPILPEPRPVPVFGLGGAVLLLAVFLLVALRKLASSRITG
jgi:hypothetical protein